MKKSQLLFIISILIVVYILFFRLPIMNNNRQEEILCITFPCGSSTERKLSIKEYLVNEYMNKQSLRNSEDRLDRRSSMVGEYVNPENTAIKLILNSVPQGYFYSPYFKIQGNPESLMVNKDDSMTWDVINGKMQIYVNFDLDHKSQLITFSFNKELNRLTVLKSTVQSIPVGLVLDKK